MYMSGWNEPNVFLSKMNYLLELLAYRSFLTQPGRTVERYIWNTWPFRSHTRMCKRSAPLPPVMARTAMKQLVSHDEKWAVVHFCLLKQAYSVYIGYLWGLGANGGMHECLSYTFRVPPKHLEKKILTFPKFAHEFLCLQTIFGIL